MATEDDEPTKGDSSDSGSDTGSDNEDGESSEVQPVEWLATARAKRSTAGNRMKAMLANEEPAADDDDLELLFAEDGDDVGFTDVEKDESDAHMDSSSDDEDQDEGAEEDAGEKELQRQAKEKKLAQRKRKAQTALPVKFRKKVRIEQPPTASQSPAPQATPHPRPKKKSERASWLPTPGELPTRASARETTKLSKEQLYQQMLEREIKRKKQVEAMEKKAKKLEATKKPPLTQAQRLAEAAAVEKRNAKSLNRWEEAEKQREEERLRKIAALQNRKLDGPVVTFWSGIQELEGDQLKHVGKMVAIEEKAPRKKRQSLATHESEPGKTDIDSKPVSPTEDSKATAGETATVSGHGRKGSQPTSSVSVQAGASSSTTTPPTMAPQVPPPPIQEEPSTALRMSDAPTSAPLPGVNNHPSAQSGPGSQSASAPSSMQPPTNQFSGSLAQPPQQSQLQLPRGPMAPPPIPPPPTSGSGFLAAPSMLGHSFGAPPRIGSQMPMMGMVAPNTQSNVLAAPNTSRLSPNGPSPLSMPQQATQQAFTVENRTAAASGGVSSTQTKSIPTAAPLQVPAATTPLQPIQGRAAAKSPGTPRDKLEAKVTKSCIILQNFDENAIKDKQVQTQILFGKKMNKLASKFLHRCFLLPPYHLTMSSRACPPSTVRHHQPPSAVPRSQDRPAILQQLRLQRDTAPPSGRL
jgi:vacuolar protein sorting-associated protein 72